MITACMDPGMWRRPRRRYDDPLCCYWLSCFGLVDEGVSVDPSSSYLGEEIAEDRRMTAGACEGKRFFCHQVGVTSCCLRYSVNKVISLVADPMTADADAGVASASSRTAVVAAASGGQRTAPNRHVGVPIVAVAGALARRCNGWTL
ncbi:hypothetical protein MLD38_001617 [Melastoma candidum]|uniref:Uncharacterized protein n=1 Tax=Melastoma candidum TaxID=119954 RepID=A0ACB9SF44_9MYRT|nr:hypothetical protein MLD38_001617 [Melastoma candidum]